MVDDMRNVLFPIGRRDGLNLDAMNIQRGRDHGLPDYNRARDYLGFTRDRVTTCFVATKQKTSHNKTI